MKLRNILMPGVMAILGGLVAVFIYAQLVPAKELIIREVVEQPVSLAGFSELDNPEFNFVDAASKSVEAVVHVRTESTREGYSSLFDLLYGNKTKESSPVLGFGSGVIISEDGYIVTNNHVIEKSDEISVKLNDKREFKAKLIGADPSTDLALLKIDAPELHFIPWGNSDELQVGEWVLAVGNPFNLTSSVTAGIVSAKGKSIGIIKEDYRMESFIQTDAAVNRGNSGGALVNIKGELVGINTAIISPSGGNAGISFAVPVSIAQKVVGDLIEFGTVQRAILGVRIEEVTAEAAKKYNLKEILGVLIIGVNDGGAAMEAGMQTGDVIVSVNGMTVNSPGELQEQISRYRPNDSVEVVIKRNGKTKQFKLTLRNLQGNTDLIKSKLFDPQLGARFEELNKQELLKQGIRYGVRVAELKPGKFSSEGIKAGFIITQINNQAVNSVEQLKSIVDAIKNEGVYIEGVYPNGKVEYYAFGLK